MDEILAPHLWHLLPKPSADEIAQAMLEVLMLPAGRTLIQALIHGYLLREPDIDDPSRILGRQDVVRNLMEMAGMGVKLRQQRGENSDGGRNEWLDLSGEY